VSPPRILSQGESQPVKLLVCVERGGIGGPHAEWRSEEREEGECLPRHHLLDVCLSGIYLPVAVAMLLKGRPGCRGARTRVDNPAAGPH